MCTAISYKTSDHYFGRNLDLERSYGECVAVTPRKFHLKMRKTESLISHYAMIGMATVADGFPLYFEATNEKGLSAAGLNFPDNADYKPYAEGKTNVTPFEFIPWILGKCADTDEAMAAMENLNLVNISFSEGLPLSPLHWFVSDRKRSVVVESTAEGLKIYEDPIGVLTNNPTFDYHMMNLNNYMHLHEGAAENRLSPNHELSNYSLGMGALGLPGDFSSASRFVKAAFVKLRSCSGESESESVSQFFHILASVAMPKGCVLAANGDYEYTRYSSCCNTDRGIYYYTTYNNPAHVRVCLFDFDLDCKEMYTCQWENCQQ